MGNRVSNDLLRMIHSNHRQKPGIHIEDHIILDLHDGFLGDVIQPAVMGFPILKGLLPEPRFADVHDLHEVSCVRTRRQTQFDMERLASRPHGLQLKAQYPPVHNGNTVPTDIEIRSVLFSPLEPTALKPIRVVRKTILPAEQEGGVPVGPNRLAVAHQDDGRRKPVHPPVRPFLHSPPVVAAHLIDRFWFR